jgi:hypothetical protein
MDDARGTCSASRRGHIGDGVRLVVDVDGFGLVPDDDGTRMRDRPTIVAMHGGPGLDHVGLKLGLESLRAGRADQAAALTTA